MLKGIVLFFKELTELKMLFIAASQYSQVFMNNKYVIITGYVLVCLGIIAGLLLLPYTIRIIIRVIKWTKNITPAVIDTPEDKKIIARQLLVVSAGALIVAILNLFSFYDIMMNTPASPEPLDFFAIIIYLGLFTFILLYYSGFTAVAYIYGNSRFLQISSFALPLIGLSLLIFQPENGMIFLIINLVIILYDLYCGYELFKIKNPEGYPDFKGIGSGFIFVSTAAILLCFTDIVFYIISGNVSLRVVSGNWKMLIIGAKFIDCVIGGIVILLMAKKLYDIREIIKQV